MTYIDIHILQTVPPSNLNRDDTGSPKTAVYGGKRRARVSSQAWKRATRSHFNAHLDRSGIGYRTKRMVELVAREIVNAGYEADAAERLAAKVVGASGIKVKEPKKVARSDQSAPSKSTAAQSDYLIFVSAGQIDRVAELAVRTDTEGTAPTRRDAQAALNEAQSFDVALFGRMVADDAELNIDAAVQVAHAISVHAVDNEYDYFTAVDDLQAADHQTGAGMIGTVEFNSSTLYRYATINVGMLRCNLGDDAAAARAAATFVDSFARSMPTGKQNTFANRTLPDAVMVVVREDQPLNLVGAFEDAIRPGRNFVHDAAEALAKFAGQVYGAYGAPQSAWIAGHAKATDHLNAIGTPVPLAEVTAAVESAVAAAIAPA